MLPQDYLTLPQSLGSSERIRRLAQQIGGDSPEEALIAIARWMTANLGYDPSAAYTWRNCDAILDTATYGGCADHAILFGALARASSVPTVWVKTMDADWIREFRATGTCTSWRGHVFLEVFLRGRWCLLNAEPLLLWEEYNPAMRLLPGNRYAYDKGPDPKTLLLSLDWERWKKQTAAYFRAFDLSRLPLGSGRDLMDTAISVRGGIFVTGDRPVYGWVARKCEALGYRVELSFNTDFETALPKAHGSHLIVTCVGDRLVLPEEYHAQYLPISVDDLRARVAREGHGVLNRRLTDGTQVVLIYGKDLDSIREAIEEISL